MAVFNWYQGIEIYALRILIVPFDPSGQNVCEVAINGNTWISEIKYWNIIEQIQEEFTWTNLINKFIRKGPNFGCVENNRLTVGK